VADGIRIGVYHLSQIQNIISLKLKTMLLTIILIAAALVGFALFFKSIDFFDKI